MKLDNQKMVEIKETFDYFANVIKLYDNGKISGEILKLELLKVVSMLVHDGITGKCHE